jgi:putative tryptophan/tyrosine transport system substrate-binding protein
MTNARDQIEAAGLISYRTNIPDQFRRAAELDKILRRAKAGDIPVEHPTKFDLVLYLITARALGLTVPASLLARADGVIE